MAKSSHKSLIYIIIAVIAIIVLVSTVNSPFGRNASVTGGCADELYMSVDGSSYSSFSDMRAKISDMSSITDAQLQSYGLSEKSDGVHACK